MASTTGVVTPFDPLLKSGRNKAATLRSKGAMNVVLKGSAGTRAKHPVKSTSTIVPMRRYVPPAHCPFAGNGKVVTLLNPKALIVPAPASKFSLAPTQPTGDGRGSG